MNRCEKCGAYLDPGERCDCDKSAAEKLNRRKVWEVLQDIKQICGESNRCQDCPFCGPGPFFPGEESCGVATWPIAWDITEDPSEKFFK